MSELFLKMGIFAFIFVHHKINKIIGHFLPLFLNIIINQIIQANGKWA